MDRFTLDEAAARQASTEEKAQNARRASAGSRY